MPGMPWDLQQQPFVSPSLPGNSTQATLAGMGSPSLQPAGDGAGTMGGGLNPDMLKRLEMYRWLMQMRGPGGMQFGQKAGGGLANQLANPGQQGGLMGALVQNPQLLQWFMQQQQGGSGQYPQSGGGVTLADLFRAPQQATGIPT